MTNIAEDIVESILGYLGDLCGIGDSLEAIDGETYDDIESNLIRIVQDVLESNE